MLKQQAQKPTKAVKKSSSLNKKQQRTLTTKRRLRSPSTITTAKRSFRGLLPLEPLRVHTPQAPDLLSRAPHWDRKALDKNEYPTPDYDGNQSDFELEMLPDITNDDMTALMENTYTRTPLDIRFDNFRKLTELSGIPRYDMGNTTLHLGLQHTLKALREEASTEYHFELSMEAAHRCMDPQLYMETMEVFKQRGFKPQLKHLSPVIHMATFRRSPETFATIMKVIGNDMKNWDQEVAENVVMFHEMHQQYDMADKVFSQAVAHKLIPIPWKHQRQSHINAAKFAQLVPSRRPKWDEPSPEADIIHLDGSPTLLSRVKIRYSCYSMQDLCENNGVVHPKINIPHNIVVQSVVRGKNAPNGETMYHKLWQPVQQEIKDYFVKFGVQTCHIARAANLFWIDHMYFDRLPTPGNQNPAKKPEYRQFKTEGRRALEIKYAIEEEEKSKLQFQRKVALGLVVDDTAASSTQASVGTTM